MGVTKAFFLVLLTAMVPVLELRAAIPLGLGLGLGVWQCAAAAVIGNMLPVPFIILFIRKVFDWLRRHWPRLEGLVERLEARAQQKKHVVQKYAVWGLILLVAIPLPGTGAWTGALVAAMLDIRLKRALPSIFLGVLIAAAAVAMLSCGIRLGIRTVG
jgi:uncharacterized membrane protein